MKYLKTYMGVTSGTLGGREDGFPEMKHVLYYDFNHLAKDYGKKKDEKYYKLTELNKTELENDVRNSLKEQIETVKELTKKELERQIEDLQKQLKEL